MPGNRSFDSERATVQVAPRQRGIGSAYPASSNGRAQPPVRQIGFGHDHEARRIPIEAVDNAGSSFGASGQGCASGHERIDQGVIPVTRRRVNYQARRLVDDGQVLVLKNQDERNGMGLDGSGRLVARELNLDPLPPGQHPGRPRGFTLDADAFIRHEAGGLGAGEPELVGEKPVKTLGFVGEDCEVDVVGDGAGFELRAVLPRFPASPRTRLHLTPPMPTPVPVDERLPARAKWLGRWLRSSPQCPPR